MVRQTVPRRKDSCVARRDSVICWMRCWIRTEVMLMFAVKKKEKHPDNCGNN